MTAIPMSVRADAAREAYLAVYKGPWGLKASSEDALLNMLVALYPADFPKFDAENIYKLRSIPVFVALADILWNIECEGKDEFEIVDEMIPFIDRAIQLKNTVPLKQYLPPRKEDYTNCPND